MGGGVSNPVNGGDASWLGVSGTTPTSKYGTLSPLQMQANNQYGGMYGSGINGYSGNQSQMNLGNGMFYANNGSLYSFNPSKYLTSTLNPSMQNVNYTPSAVLNNQLAQANQMFNLPLPQKQLRVAPKPGRGR